MKVSTAEIRSIVATLPIGLYAKRRIPLDVIEGEETSYYNPITDEIIISADIIKKSLEKVSNISDIETAIRSMCYHEVSHAILTPKGVEVTDAFNIFEDERIETLLNNYYFDTDFKKQLLTINGFTDLTDVPTVGLSPEQKFYSVVRFGIGEKQYTDRVDELIKKYANITSNTNEYWRKREYFNDIETLYYDITGEKPKRRTTKADTVSYGDGKEGDEASTGDTALTESDEGETISKSTDGKPCHGRPNPLTTEEINKMIEDVIDNPRYRDTKLTEELSIILENFSKKNNSGSAVATYSGVFNPRAVANREDYRFFDRKANINGMNKFGTFHLNLFIDESGSFHSSEDAMNTLLRSLTEIERKNKNFTLDVVFCGISERVVKDKRKRVFKASGGNKLDKKVYEIYRKLQKPNTFNYNIACFDGDACSDGGSGDHGFGAFNHANCTIISDNDNRRYINKDVHEARVVYTRDYTKELVKNVTDALAKAFR